MYMRKLTIKRNKTIVGCLMKLKVYIEDPTSQEIVISDTPCRKLGELKSGEEQSFDIGENAAKVFVIADRISKNYCNDFYQLSEGSEDIYLSGKNKYNPANGNAFRFDNNDNNVEVLKNRKKGLHKGLIVLIVAILVGFVFGFAITGGLFSGIFKKAAKTQTFTADKLSITMTGDYYVSDMKDEAYAGIYESEDTVIFVLKEPFEALEELKDLTAEQYGELTIQAHQLSDSKVLTTESGQPYFVHGYYDQANDARYIYRDYIYKSSDAFWLVQCACALESADAYAPTFDEFASTVTFE